MIKTENVGTIKNVPVETKQEGKDLIERLIQKTVGEGKMQKSGLTKVDNGYETQRGVKPYRKWTLVSGQSFSAAPGIGVSSR